MLYLVRGRLLREVCPRLHVAKFMCFYHLKSYR